MCPQEEREAQASRTGGLLNVLCGLRAWPRGEAGAQLGSALRPPTVRHPAGQTGPCACLCLRLWEPCCQAPGPGGARSASARQERSPTRRSRPAATVSQSSRGPRRGTAGPCSGARAHSALRAPSVGAVAAGGWETSSSLGGEAGLPLPYLCAESLGGPGP